MHTTLPPELAFPPRFTDPTFLRAGFTGTTLEGDYAPKGEAAIRAAGGVTITTGRWTGLFIPWLEGANSTPATMLMSPMLLMYPQAVREAYYIESAERGYDDIIYASEGWNMPENGFANTPAAILAFAQEIQAHGFRPVYWRGLWRQRVDDMFRALWDAGVVSAYIHGKEVDADGPAEVYEASLAEMDRFIAGRAPIFTHFRANFERMMGYPIGFPLDTFLNDWSKYNGRVHLALQLPVDASAGRQSAAVYYARKHVNLGANGGGDAAKGPGAPDSRVCLFEVNATALLEGRRVELEAARRTFELTCGTRDDARVWPAWGYADTGWKDDGTPL